MGMGTSKLQRGDIIHMVDADLTNCEDMAADEGWLTDSLANLASFFHSNQNFIKMSSRCQ